MQPWARNARLISVRGSWNRLIHAVLALALIAVGAGWYGERDDTKMDTNQRFESCRWDGGVLVLTYVYGANQVVSPSIDTRGKSLVVALEVEEGDGVTPAIGLTGETRFGISGRDDKATLTYPDGRRLACPIALTTPR